MADKEEKTTPIPSKREEAPKRKAGRPCKIDWGSEETLAMVENLGRIGFTQDNVADYYGVNPSTVYRNKVKHTRLCTALKMGKTRAISSVAAALFKKAMSGNVTAMIFYLKNRDPANWADVQRLEHSGEIELKERMAMFSKAVAKHVPEKDRIKIAEFIEKEMTNE